MNLPGSRDSIVKNCVTSEIEFLSLSLSFFLFRSRIDIPDLDCNFNFY